MADIYTRRLEEARNIAPNAKPYLDYRHLLEDTVVDAVLIATPQHLHAEHFTAALDAGKHVYQEKTMAFTVEHAKHMRAACAAARAGGARSRSATSGLPPGRWPTPSVSCKPRLMGKITGIEGRMYRNTPHGKPQWARPVSIRT